MIFNSPEDAVKLAGHDPKSAIHIYKSIYGVKYIFQLDDNTFIYIHVAGYKGRNKETGKEIWWHPVRISPHKTLGSMLRELLPDGY
jgi:hypothetical protein